jgi:RNA polymerase-binding transcription factor DksA
MAARSPANKAGKATAAPAKKATRAPASAKPKPGNARQRTAAGRSSAKPSRQSAKQAPSKSPAKGASKAVSRTPTTSPSRKAGSSAAKATAKRTAKPPAKRAPKPAIKASAKQPAKHPAKPTHKPAKQPVKAAVKESPPTPAQSPIDGIPKPKFSKEGLGYTKDFDLAFVRSQYELLQRERAHLTGQAHRLEAEAHQLVEEAEMGDVQFDDEGGEGDTMVVERERDLALSAQARDAVAEIDAALARISAGTYGYSILSGRPIPKERLEAIPWSSVLVEEKVGGIGRR